MGIAAVAAIITVAAVLSAGNARSPDIAALTFVVLCSAVAATAVVEVLKRLFSFRGAFQYRAVRRWLQPPEEAYESVERQWKQWARDQIESGSPELAGGLGRLCPARPPGSSRGQRER
jgi:hypothetical protein